MRGFLRDYGDGASRDTAEQTLRHIEAGLEDTAGDDAVQVELASLRRDFKLRTDPLDPVPDFEQFRARLGQLPYKARLAERETATGSSPISSE